MVLSTETAVTVVNQFQLAFEFEAMFAAKTLTRNHGGASLGIQIGRVGRACHRAHVRPTSASPYLLPALAPTLDTVAKFSQSPIRSAGGRFRRNGLDGLGLLD